MNLAALPELIASWLKNQGTALLEPGKTALPAGRDVFHPGESYHGKVLENLPGGRNLVQVGGQQLNMALPRGAQAGDAIRLTYLHNVPRPTFLMEQAAVSAAQPVRLSQTAQQLTALAQLARPAAGTAVAPAAAGAATAPPATGTPVPAPVTTPVPAQPGQAGVGGQRPILSNVAPLANPPSLAGGSGIPLAPLAGVFASATALTGATPVDGASAGLAAGTTTSNLAALQPGVAESQPALPQRLHQTLRESGLFYEAHLARWTRGTFALADLRNEPQARLVHGAASPALPAELAGMPEEAAHLAGRQLLMLEGAPFLWQGFAWPGQWLEWQVQERPGGEAGAGEEPTIWATELRMTLPRLGGVTARLSLAGDRLSVGLGAQDAATRAAMSAALPELQRALEAAGLKPAGLSVEPADAGLAATA